MREDPLHQNQRADKNVRDLHCQAIRLLILNILVLSPIINIVFYRQGAKVAKNIIIDFTEPSWRS